MRGFANPGAYSRQEVEAAILEMARCGILEEIPK